MNACVICRANFLTGKRRFAYTHGQALVQGLATEYSVRPALLLMARFAACFHFSSLYFKPACPGGAQRFDHYEGVFLTGKRPHRRMPATFSEGEQPGIHDHCMSFQRTPRRLCIPAYGRCKGYRGNCGGQFQQALVTA